jgi:signal transduction histidine kinase
MGIGYYLIERFLHDPMNGFMLALEEGKHSGTPIPIQRVSRISEIRRLTDRYNEMTSEISAKQNELKHLNNSLRNKVVSQSREIATMRAAREKMKFLSGVSHELRTPLHAILGFTRLGLEKSQSQDQPAFERY